MRIATPNAPKPAEAAQIVDQIVQHFSWKGKAGAGFPSVVQKGIIQTAANINKGWVKTDAKTLLEKTSGIQFHILNDADAAGMAEMRFGAGKDVKKGVVLILTLGTGIGSALFTDGHLVPNLEFGHIQMDGKDAEKRTASVVKT